MNENNQPNKTFYCDNCQMVKNGSFSEGSYYKRKVDAPFEPRMHKKLCYICLACSPYVKEYNEAQDQDRSDNPYKLY